MPVQRTIQIGEPVLREPTSAITDPHDPLVHEVINDLVDTMRSEGLIGIAAPQIGKSLRIFATEIRETETRRGVADPLRVYINPQITEVSREMEFGWEGCGSVPGIFGHVERHAEVAVEYLDVEGAISSKHCVGLLARVVQHEIDHLNGVLFTDVTDPATFVSREYYIQHIRGN